MQFLLRLVAFAATWSLLAQAGPISAAGAGRVLPGKWIVTLRPDADGAAITSHLEQVREIHGRNVRRGGAEHEYGGVERRYGFGRFKGYAGSFGAATVEELRRLPEVGVFFHVVGKADSATGAPG
jgi:oryzin